MGEIIQTLGLNATIVAQIFNLIVIIIFLVMPVVIILGIFRYFRSLDTRVRKLEEILIDRSQRNEKRN